MRHWSLIILIQPLGKIFNQPSYLGLIRSISWLLMPWLLGSPGHKQPWYWICRIGRSLSYSRRNFNYLCLIGLEEWHKCKYMFMFSLKNLARKGWSGHDGDLLISEPVSYWFHSLSFISIAVTIAHRYIFLVDLLLFWFPFFPWPYH